MTTDRVQSETPTEYRLCRKANGETLLQAGFRWVEIDDDFNEKTGVEWRDIETARDAFALTRDALMPVSILLLARQLAEVHLGDNDELGQIGREVAAAIDAALKA